jgi:hypoxanthine-DNA glycosylase
MSQRSSGAVRGQHVATPVPAAALRGFAPIIDNRVECLILGSFPSAASLAAGQYYAHPRNQFWLILGRLLDEPLAELPYDERTRRVLSHRVGIWDVFGACEREGSADTAIRHARPNAFKRLYRLAPRLDAIAFNGSAAGRFQPLFEQAGFAVRVLPSTSPAHAGRSLEQKLALWAAWWRAPRGGLMPGRVLGRPGGEG